jgi:DNA adenine methylase
VVIEQLPYHELIRRYDGPGVLFYLDPPYVGCETDYGDGFAPEDFQQLSDILGQLKGRFMLSINDTPLAREVFATFQIEEVETTYMLATKMTGAGKRVGELIISGP